MTSCGSNVRDELRQLISSGQLSEDSVVAITRIHPEKLRAWLADASLGSGMTTDRHALSADESAQVSQLVALTYVADVDDDERLHAILESLTIECRLSLENIAQLTGIDVDDLRRFLDDPKAVSAATKFAMAVKCSYIVSVLNLVRRG